MLEHNSSPQRPFPPGDWVSLAVVSKGEYGVPEGLQFGFPIVSTGNSWSIVEGLRHDEFASEKIKATAAELVAERSEVESLLGK